MLVELSGDKGCVQKYPSAICYCTTLKTKCYLFLYMCLGAPLSSCLEKEISKLSQAKRRNIESAKQIVPEAHNNIQKEGYFNHFLLCNL